MTRFLSNRAKNTTPYTPGEQPLKKNIIKLNTNENPYPPSPSVLNIINDFKYNNLKLYPTPHVNELRTKTGDIYNLPSDMVFCGNGSDEVLAFIFMAFTNPNSNVYISNITYGFYEVYANIFDTNILEIPLNNNFTINTLAYKNLQGVILIANPNAPTGLTINEQQIKGILQNNPNALVIIDEAYIDFSCIISCVNLCNNYDNLIVVQTMSKSRGLAGIRIGFAFGNKSLIQGLERIKFSINPYNINSLSNQVAIASLNDTAYFNETLEKIIKTREATSLSLRKLGFFVTDSQANFLFVSHNKISAKEIYEKLYNSNIITRYFNKQLINIANFI